MKINNENEKYILRFIFHTNISHIKSSRIPVMKTMSTLNIKLWGDNKAHKSSDMIIH